MTIQHALDDLLEESPARILIQSAPLNNIIEKLAALQKLHDDGDLHILKREAVIHFDDVVVTEGFQDFGFNEDGVNVAYRTNVLCLDCLDGEFLSCELMDSQVHFAEPSLAQNRLKLVLTETAARVKILPFSRVQHGLVFYVGQIVVKILSSIGVKKSQVVMREVLLDVIEG